MLTHPEALALAHEAVEIRERLQGFSDRDLAAPLALGALALLEADDPAAALALINRSRQLARPSEHPPTAIFSAALGLTVLALGRADEAREPLERAHAQLAPASELATRVAKAHASLNNP
ncbi:hypothetical protein DB30_02607 [Enhygromyxa salina]|uniref:Tetratricopeptide repeat protein n=1 Tax=Enhygromyxa salina TaxID=215803 RepID=A0A0C2CKJ2_9BACT|nr:hypothetical protein DB30_02607 [Enhygromyxa salina]